MIIALLGFAFYPLHFQKRPKHSIIIIIISCLYLFDYQKSLFFLSYFLGLIILTVFFPVMMLVVVTCNLL